MHQRAGIARCWTVLIADDRKILRNAIRKVLELDPDIKVVGEAENFPKDRNVDARTASTRYRYGLAHACTRGFLA
jgi:DNA-binding NarL/FixJ family response regulator